jgi:hypothetical protein
MTQCPKEIWLVWPAKYVSVSNGSSTFWYSTGRVPSGVPPYGVFGLRGHKRRSSTQIELRPSLSASFEIYTTFSLVAKSPTCGNSIPAFIIYTKSDGHLLLKPEASFKLHSPSEYSLKAAQRCLLLLKNE